MKNTLKLAIATFALSGAAVFAGGHMPLEVSDQKASTSVTIAVANIDVAGFVTIHGSTAEGDMIAPASLGHTFVEAGNHSDIVVELATAVASGTTLYAMLHVDNGQQGIYEFGVDSTEFDGPYMNGDAPVIASFSVK